MVVRLRGAQANCLLVLMGEPYRRVLRTIGRCWVIRRYTFEIKRGHFDQASTCEPVRTLSANSMATSSFVHTRSIMIHPTGDVTPINIEIDHSQFGQYQFLPIGRRLEFKEPRLIRYDHPS